MGLAGLLIGCAVGGGVVAIASHHGDRHERHHHERFDKPRIMDQRDRGPLRRQPPQPRRFPLPGPAATTPVPPLPTPLPTS